jgi:hypothetical protein
MTDSERASELQCLLEAWGALLSTRQLLLRLLTLRFKCPVPESVSVCINRQDDREMLLKWFDTALDANTLQDFVAVLP